MLLLFWQDAGQGRPHVSIFSNIKREGNSIHLKVSQCKRKINISKKKQEFDFIFSPTPKNHSFVRPNF